ncbi:MAG: iron ABC transporter permease [Hyphomicrobiaceae bacterium]|nr:iron ABC transporter permease [Hyphomicrobiaceae bacterium]
MTSTTELSSSLRLGVARLRSAGNFGWSAAAVIISLIVAAPLLAIAILGLESSGNTWPHLLSTVLPSSVMTTFGLMIGVGLTTLLVGAGTAWLVTMFRFPGRDLYVWLLLVPLAMPTYIIAFCYMELLDYAGTVQTAMRETFGWRSPADYWFPDIRSLGGGIFVMSFVLYPYVYITARASFLQQSVCVLEVSRTLGRTAWGTFWSVALPLARPALVAGITLALMETLNDIGAVEFLGIQTLTASVYATWLERSSLAGAAQISCVMLLFVFTLIYLERSARRRQHFHHTTGKYTMLPEQKLGRVHGLLAAVACALPILIGFALPMSVLSDAAVSNLSEGLNPEFWRAAWHSFVLASSAAVVAVIVGTTLAFACRASRSKLVRGAAGVASVGYAVPGTVLAIGILVPFGAFDNALDGVMRSNFGISTGLLLTGSGVGLVFAYTVRFLAIAYGTVDAGFKKTSTDLDGASRTLGATLTRTLFRVHLPILTPVLGAAAVLVFVDSMKELPATLLLRPFNFDTLATHVYTLASLDLFEDGAIAAFAIVAIGLIPVYILHRAIETGRPGARASR